MVKIKINDNLFLVAESNVENGFNEVMVYLQSDDGLVLQDLACIGQCFKFDNTTDKVNYEDKFYVKVYADEYDEDYTDEFKVNVYKGEEE